MLSRCPMSDLLVLFWLKCRSVFNSLTSRHRPPKDLPEELAAEFTLDGTVPVLRSYFNDVRTRPLRWTTRSFWWNPDKVKHRVERYYKKTDRYLYDALERYSLSDKEIVVVGSEMPWYECILTCFGAKTTTIEYRQIRCHIPGLKVLTPDEYHKNPTYFDMAVSISSIEHDGLGRYGDPIDPNGDLRAMRELKDLLKPGGLLLLAVPIGPDAVVWNAHRIYGRKRFPMLIQEWELVDSFGFEEELFDGELGKYDNQPVFVLRPRS